MRDAILIIGSTVGGFLAAVAIGGWYVVNANHAYKKALELTEKAAAATDAATTIETAYLAMTEETTYLSAVAEKPERLRFADWWRERFSRAEQTPDWAEGEILAMPPAQLEPAPPIPAKPTLGSRWGHHLNRADWPNKTVRRTPASAVAFTPLSLAMKLAAIPDPTRALRVQRSF